MTFFADEYKQKVVSITRFFPLILLLFYSASIVADKISLKNGRYFTGQIKKESATHITIDIGGGTISLPRTSIKSFSKNDHSSNQSYRKPVNALIDLNPPPELMDLAVAYKTLIKDRFSAIQAKKKTHDFKINRAELIKRHAREKQNRTALAQQINSIDPNLNLQQYNTLAHQQNQSTIRLNSIENDLSKSFKGAISDKKIISHYLKTLDTFKNQANTNKSKQINSETQEQAHSFWKKLDKKLAQLDNELKLINVPHTNTNDHMILKMRINERVEGQFLLDTGATYVTLSQEMANQLNLNFDSALDIPLVLADNTTVTGKLVMLDSMRVGDIQADRITAVVLPSSPSKGVSGLLGMSFLREFVINFDPANKKLVFKKFKP